MKIWAIKVIPLLLASPVCMAGHTEIFSGTAKNDDGKLVYTEKHEVHFDDDGHVQDAETKYYNSKNDLIATLKSDFSTSLTSPAHSMSNIVTGNTQGLRNQDDKLILFNQDLGKSEETKTLPKNFGGDRVAFGCQGLSYFLVKNLDMFEQKKVLPIKFLIPGNLDSYDFEIRYVRESEKGVVEFDIEIDNWFLKIFAPKLRAKYDKVNRHLIWYKGLSNIKDENGKNQNVTIEYTYADK